MKFQHREGIAAEIHGSCGNCFWGRRRKKGVRDFNQGLRKFVSDLEEHCVIREKSSLEAGAIGPLSAFGPINSY